RSLQVLDLTHNELTQIPREALQDCAFALQNISLGHNRISLLDRQAFGHLPIVFHVELQHNYIKELEPLAFDGLLQLLTLDLSHNELVQISDSGRDASGQSFSSSTRTVSTVAHSPFEPLLSAEMIDLSFNHISYLNDVSFPKSPYIPYKLTRVKLLGNPVG